MKSKVVLYEHEGLYKRRSDPGTRTCTRHSLIFVSQYRSRISSALALEPRIKRLEGMADGAQKQIATAGKR